MKTIRLTDEGYETLLNDLPENLPLYVRNRTADWIREKYGQRRLFVELEDEMEWPQLKAGRQSGQTAMNNCLEMYRCLPFTPELASDFQVWAALAHSDALYPFVRNSLNQEFENMPDKRKLIVLRNSFFQLKGSGRRALVTNRLSRLWWTAFLADTGFGSQNENLKLLCDLGLAASLNEIISNRTYVNSPKVLQGVINGIQSFVQTGKELNRDNVLRPALNNFNIRCGGILIDCLDLGEISRTMFESLRQGSDVRGISWDETGSLIEEEDEMDWEEDE